MALLEMIRARRAELEADERAAEPERTDEQRARALEAFLLRLQEQHPKGAQLPLDDLERLEKLRALVGAELLDALLAEPILPLGGCPAGGEPRNVGVSNDGAAASVADKNGASTSHLPDQERRSDLLTPPSRGGHPTWSWQQSRPGPYAIVDNDVGLRRPKPYKGSDPNNPGTGWMGS